MLFKTGKFYQNIVTIQQIVKNKIYADLKKKTFYYSIRFLDIYLAV